MGTQARTGTTGAPVVPRIPAAAGPAATGGNGTVVVPVGVAPRRKGDRRPVPARNELYGHLSIDGLRSYRTALTHEEGNVSYWRRILQARLDVVTATGGGRELDTDRLRPVLTTERIDSGRRALVEILPVDDIPPLPSLSELWERRVADDDDAGRAAFADELRTAEAQLSEYRSALHRRIGEATGELIARYREQPELCLTALPAEPGRRASA